MTEARAPVFPTAAASSIYDQGARGYQRPAASLSDYRFKTDVTPVALLTDGVTLYSFRYFGSDQVYVGVMAQQVAPLDPQAVSMRDGGYFWVDYGRLGLKMQTFEEWQAQTQLGPELRYGETMLTITKAR